MFEFFRSLVQLVAPIFVVSTMLNVGLTQKLSDIIGHLKNYPFVIKILAANFVVAPLLMIAALYLAPFDPALKAGLLIFSLCAGAPFLIKLTQAAEHNVALGAAVMMLLMVVTVVYTPIVLPLVLSGISVDAGAVAKALLLQLLLPIAAGMLAAQLLPDLARKAQPWVGWLGNVTLYVLVGATLIGYFPNMIAIVGTGAILVGLAFVAAAFGVGYLAGAGKDHLEDVGGLGTAQRNTAAGVIIATQNFGDHPNVLVMITLANTLGIVMLLLIAKRLSRDHKITVRTV
ncbi:MAG TPA: bile acid:sodium symporter [Pyrinomonadaceae bacterium]|nr:bile acid:sodium symporter [Pyrinomonadaceae bacterium]